jgi:Arc/MetJ-type ribon-helix-helix transcriptional regulator
MSTTIDTAIEPLIRRKIFSSQEEAIRELLREYILRQIDTFREEVNQFEQKYGMGFQQFSEYLHERSILLEKGDFSAGQRQALGQAVMQEEDDWLEWKADQEMLESWLGLRQEVSA